MSNRNIVLLTTIVCVLFGTIIGVEIVSKKVIMKKCVNESVNKCSKIYNTLRCFEEAEPLCRYKSKYNNDFNFELIN